jgi:hypothetical protein
MPLRVRTVFSGGPGAPCLSTIYFNETGGAIAADAAAAAAGVRAFWLSLQGIIADVWRADVQPEVAQVDAATGEVTTVQSATTAQVVMTASNTGLPQAVQGVVRLRTGDFIDGREVRGRIFIPGLTQASNNQGDLTSTAQSTILTAANAMRTDSATILAVYQREREPYINKKGEAIPHRDGSIHGVTACSVWSEFGVLRSRRL